MTNELAIGEVVASNTTSFSAVIPTAFGEALPVKFGSLVKTETGSLRIFGIVSMIEHAPTEPNRKVSPHGKTKASLKKEMPQVFELLQTEFRALIVAYQQNGVMIQTMPPAPPDLHDFAHLALEQEVDAFFSKSPAYLRAILNSRDVAPDELLVSFLRNYLPLLHRSRLVEIGKELAYLLADDHRRLEAILTRIHD